MIDETEKQIRREDSSVKHRRKLVFFTEFYYPEQSTTSCYLTDIIRTAASVWHGPIKIYTASGLGENEEILKQDHIRIRRFSSGRLNKNSLWERMLKFFLITFKFSWSALWSIAKDDVVFTVTNPAFMLVFLSLLRKFKRFHYMLLIYDIFPEVLIPTGLSHETSFAYKLTLKIYNWAYRQVDQFIVIGRDMKDVVSKKTGKEENIAIIPNWVDVNMFKPKDDGKSEILNLYGLTGKRVFSMIGNMGRAQGLDNLLDGIRRFSESGKIHFLLAGDGACGEKITKFSEDNPKVPLTYVRQMKKESREAMLNAGDVSIIPLASGMYGLGVPSKSYFNMAAGKPLLFIGDDRSEIARLIKEQGLGWVVPPGDPEKLVETIRNIAKLSDEELKAYALKSREVAEKYFASEKVLTKYEELFQNC